MNLQLFLLLIVVVTALAFDFTNGFHDTGNAMATSIASGALAPRVAVALSAVLNLIGAFLSTAVAATIAKGLIDANLVTLELVFAGLVGGIVWNLLTWLLGIPSSSSHALIGGIVGATIAAVGLRGVIWSGVVSKVIVPAVVAALLATLVGAVGTWLVYRTTRGVAEKRTERGFRRGQIGSASLVSLAHGTNDAQKTMGVIFLALMSYGAVSTTASVPPLWVIVSCAVAMAAGTYLGGWRIIRTLGKGLVEIKPPQGMAAESSSAAVILLSAHFGYALSTTQVATGSVLGSGVGKPGAEVRWGVAGRMVVAWLVTLPLAGLVGAFTYGLVHFIGGYPGAILGFALLWLTATAIWLRSRRAPIDHTNVNADWEGNLTAGLEAGAQPLADQRPPVPAPPAPTPPPNHRAPQFGVTTRNAP
ncbi:low-affinity inorganic phosphate transporter [Mycobacterium tuberculosis]|uniref:Probable low-affinity inorganic phosphate transporter n=20 Tax=Mycobacterium tuberculosis complex TaxID=77643 RepID=PIT_MYCBO|nr:MULTISPECIES: inorganic phosphate transporter [Mycobacterium]P59950.1 RecName: Full=Probable low-affinity inorganic phosphate transporter [Mycobacterium tuberculosis variant bovis AF2122/97]P9WIA6.1 RecName: Full=Probable low-affinity inorganic phosphate transporter [Mycobacterium tuberculosis CDC1551]AGJ66557.1 inorganic phosphate transporter [Mycobacterium tuberculosis str. Beijing/NITR203]AGL22303.1 phosphate transport protein [Mycobacterium tuberculosis str. Haarlem/NITR202]AGL29977.1 i